MLLNLINLNPSKKKKKKKKVKNQPWISISKSNLKTLKVIKNCLFLLAKM